MSDLRHSTTDVHWYWFWRGRIEKRQFHHLSLGTIHCDNYLRITFHQALDPLPCNGCELAYLAHQHQARVLEDRCNNPIRNVQSVASPRNTTAAWIQRQWLRCIERREYVLWSVRGTEIELIS